MKTVVKHSFRFFLWWLLFLVTVHAITIIAVSATVMIDPDTLVYVLGATILYPLSSLFFAWLFLRKTSNMSLPELVELSLAWGILFALASAFLGPILYGVPWHIEFTDAISVVIDMCIIGAFFAVGYKIKITSALQNSAEVNLLDDTTVQTSHYERGL